jgi:hypothetical protein
MGVARVGEVGEVLWCTCPGTPLSLETLTLLKWEDRHGHQRTFRLEDMVSAKWMKFGLRVGLTMDQLEFLEKRYKNASRCWLEVMRHWLNDGGTQHYPATWEGLYTLMRDCDLSEIGLSFLKALEHSQP